MVGDPITMSKGVITMSKDRKDKLEGQSWFYARVQNLIWLDNNFDVYAKTTYCIICKHADLNTNEAFPSLNRIAKQGSFSQEKARQSVDSLVEAGYITKQNRRDKKGNNKSNLYKIKDISYIFNALQFAKNNDSELLENKIIDSVNEHPIPTEKEIYKIIGQSNVSLEESEEEKRKEELEELYEQGYR